MTAFLPSVKSASSKELADRQFAVLQEAFGQASRSFQTEMADRHQDFLALLKKRGVSLEQWTDYATRALIGGALAGTLLMVPGAKQSPSDAAQTVQAAAPAASAQLAPTEALKPVDVGSELKNLLPDAYQAPTSAGEQQIGQMLSSAFHVSAVPELDGHRLNKVLTVMGGEQHLRRFPGDVASEHTGLSIAPGAGGIAPGNGAYGLWANSKAGLSDEAVNQEQYYIAAQTFLAPGFRDNPNTLYQWFKYRKMIAVNAKTGQACVVDIGDAGPASWTGKSSGGSPEVLDVLGLGEGSRKGPVLLYFIDDPNNTVPLGPIQAQAPVTVSPARGGS